MQRKLKRLALNTGPEIAAIPPTLNTHSLCLLSPPSVSASRDLSYQKQMFGNNLGDANSPCEHFPVLLRARAIRGGQRVTWKVHRLVGGRLQETHTTSLGEALACK